MAELKDLDRLLEQSQFTHVSRTITGDVEISDAMPSPASLTFVVARVRGDGDEVFFPKISITPRFFVGTRRFEFKGNFTRLIVDPSNFESPDVKVVTDSQVDQYRGRGSGTLSYLANLAFNPQWGMSGEDTLTKVRAGLEIYRVWQNLSDLDRGIRKGYVSNEYRGGADTFDLITGAGLTPRAASFMAETRFANGVKPEDFWRYAHTVMNKDLRISNRISNS